jgi:hypothetical protein
VIDRLRHELPTKTPKEAVMFYYFDYKDQANQTLEMFARSLLKQMLCLSDHIPQEVHEFYDQCTKGTGKLDVASVSHLINSCSTRLSTLYLVLDALDEYQHKIKTLLSFLNQLKSAKEPRSKILCTTRPHLADFAGNLDAFATVEIQPDNPDVEKYIKGRLDEEWEHHEDLKVDVLEALMGQKDIE